MIKYFSVENFRSIKNEQCLKMELDNQYFPACPVIGITGNNASGKGNFLKAVTNAIALANGKTPDFEPFWKHKANNKYHLIFSDRGQDRELKAQIGKAGVSSRQINAFNTVKLPQEGDRYLLGERSNKGEYQRIVEMITQADIDLTSPQLKKIVCSVVKGIVTGGVTIVEDFDSGIHPHTAKYLIEILQNKHFNSKNTQLFFSFFNASLLSVLKPEETWFAEKNSQGETTIYSAADFTDVDPEKIEQYYRTGRLGAVPLGVNCF